VRPLKIISGGQTGVDRAALDVAIDLGIPHGGWCPRGRKAEDGCIPDRYLLDEMPTGEYYPRTERNVVGSTATLVLYSGLHLPVSPGTLLTQRVCRDVKRLRGDAWQWAVINLHPDANPLGVGRLFLHDVAGTAVLNIAGPRESKCPGIYEAAKAFLLEVLR
jgi:hypothetical protein